MGGEGAALIGGASPFGWASLGASVLGGALNAAKGQPAGPSSAFLESQTGITFDSSGWVVATGQGSASGYLSKTDPGMTNSNSIIPVSNGGVVSGLPSVTGLVGSSNWMLYALIAVGIYLVLK